MDVLAVNNFGDTRSGGLAGPMGLFLIVLMCVATVLLIRNMNKRIRRLPDSFPVANERDRVAGIAQPSPEAPRPATTDAAEVERDRSVVAAQVEDAEVAGLRDDQGGASAGDAPQRS